MDTDSDSIPLIDTDSATCRVKVSSVLNRDTKQFGKHFMFDGSEETCWNSDQGIPQYVSLDLGKPACVNTLSVRFQGGFAGKDSVLLGGASELGLQEVLAFHPNDSSSLQTFVAPTNCTACSVYKVVFRSSTDFFGRVTVYHLQLFGSWKV